MSDPVVDVRNLRYRYDDGTEALKGIDFQLRAGECVAVLGANGSGKSTFLLHLNGLLEGEGEVTICGQRLSRSTVKDIRNKVGLVFQDSDNQLFMPTVLEDVAFGALNAGMPQAEAILAAHAAMRQTGIDYAAAKAPYHLSSGEKKRVAIAGILATQPAVLVLDEPTTFLDPPGRRALSTLLAGLTQAKIIVTHDVEFARELSGRAVFFEHGRIVGEGTVEEVVTRFNWNNRTSNFALG